jgi:hypothetical protein
MHLLLLLAYCALRDITLVIMVLPRALRQIQDSTQVLMVLSKSRVLPVIIPHLRLRALAMNAIRERTLRIPLPLALLRILATLRWRMALVNKNALLDSFQIRLVHRSVLLVYLERMHQLKDHLYVLQQPPANFQIIESVSLLALQEIIHQPAPQSVNRASWDNIRTLASLDAQLRQQEIIPILIRTIKLNVHKDFIVQEMDHSMHAMPATILMLVRVLVRFAWQDHTLRKRLRLVLCVQQVLLWAEMERLVAMHVRFAALVLMR